MFVLKRGTELSTDHHLVVCTLKALKPLKKRKTFRPREAYRIKWESLDDKEVRTAFADNIASKFKELPTSTEDTETEWCLFRTAVITSATNCCGRKRVGGTKSSEKRTLGGTKKLKKLFVRKKWPIRPGLQTSHHLNFVRSTLKHVRRQPQKLNCLRKGPGRNLEKGWTMNPKRQTKYPGRPFAVCVEKDLEPLSLSKIPMV